MHSLTDTVYLQIAILYVGKEDYKNGGSHGFSWGGSSDVIFLNRGTRRIQGLLVRRYTNAIWCVTSTGISESHKYSNFTILVYICFGSLIAMSQNLVLLSLCFIQCIILNMKAYNFKTIKEPINRFLSNVINLILDTVYINI